MTEGIDETDKFLGDEYMSQSSTGAAETASKSQSLILQRLQEPGRQVAMATVLGLSESAVSRMLSPERLGPLCKMLATAGLKVVPAETHTISPDKFAALWLFAKERIDQIKGVEDLS